MTQNNCPDPSETPTSDYQDADSFQVKAQGHAFTFYPRGSDRLEALVDHIDKAQKSLAIFYYMFQHDHAGAQILAALVKAVERGVDVHLIIDAFGSDAPDHFFDPLVEAGGRFDVFAAKWNVRYLIRNHQKFVIADNARVLTGGNNVSDHYYDTPENNGWCDLGVAIEGKVVDQFADWFILLRDWVQSEGSQLRRMRRMVKQWDAGEGPVRLLVGGPLVRKSHWAWQFKTDLVHAQSLDTVSAYFSPPSSMRRLMARVARRGRMRMITAGKSDIDATIDVARLLYRKLLKAGTKIFEFQPCKLHMKLLIADNVSYFGSANLDKRSVRINVELMVRVEDGDLADRLRDFITTLEAASMPVTREWYAQEAGLFNRMRWTLSYWIALADYRVARSLNKPSTP
ncbi:phospholipase D-like domain-containing protein [Erythrobacter crassostreae]|uniref:Phospholipase D n=1 Tax=Erythrobacter crassostreae TaxID=2828328 RepID=A0A9X1JLE4_9SPHN|nr:phosphatidylserine/phosphatidylglycerophosphate/cardiolipin synthase family protein [Erythrobacter crassostrea]